MQVELKVDDVRPIVRACLVEILEREDGILSQLDRERIAYPEREAAALLGVAPHVVRDLRLKGQLHGKRFGRGVLYEKQELIRFLRERDD